MAFRGASDCVRFLFGNVHSSCDKGVTTLPGGAENSSGEASEASSFDLADDGRVNSWPTHRIPILGGTVLRPGRNIIY